MWDLTDRNADVVELRNGQTGAIIPRANNTDNVFIGSNGKHEVRALFEMLGSGEKTGHDLRNRLIRTYPAQSTQIEQLFNAYGY
ncbi:MAG: hypothetical protein Q4G08_05305 [Capnocytophaga sp.]|nr:hypothetical protein [Capnocytophaga sp.]